MTRYTWLVLTNPAEGAEQEFNRWYDGEHVPDMLTVDGVLAVQRLEFVASGDSPGPEQKYLAIYEIEAESPDAAIATIGEALAEPGRMRRTATLDPDHRQWYFRPLGPRVCRD